MRRLDHSKHDLHEGLSILLSVLFSNLFNLFFPLLMVELTFFTNFFLNHFYHLDTKNRHENFFLIIFVPFNYNIYSQQI